MTSRSLKLLTGLLIAISVTAAAHAQHAGRQTLADRIRNWAQDDEPTAAATDVPPTGHRIASAPNDAAPTTERRGFPQIDARSLLPRNLFGLGNDEPPATVEPPAPASGRKLQTVPMQRQQATSASRARSAHSAATTEIPLRTAARPRPAATRSSASLHGSFTLPGLGGSPLPGNAVAPVGPAESKQRIARSPQAAAATRSTASISRPTRQAPTATQSQAHVDDTAPPISLNPATGATGSTRQSPHRRAPLHVDAEVLRRELAGAFPTDAESRNSINLRPSSSETLSTAETTLASPYSTSHDTERPVEPVAETDAQAARRSNEPLSTESPVSLPVVEDAASEMRMQNFSRPSPGVSAMELKFQSQPLIQHDTLPQREDNSAHRSEQSATSSELTFGWAKPASPPDAAAESKLPTAKPFATAQPSVAFPSTTRRRDIFGDRGPAPVTDPNVLASHQTPVITTDIRGPKQILIGREATYRVRLQNQSQISAEGIIANIRIPAGADIIDTATTHGTIQQSRDAQAPGGLLWQLTRLEAGASESLDVRLVPRSSRPLELGVSWTLAPIGSRAVVEVQEPKLRLHVSGPDEVLFGKSQLYRLTLTNPGTGLAENVKIDLFPPGGGDDAVTSHDVGDLPAGTSQSIEVELTAREAGKLCVKAVATAEGDLSSDASKDIFCRKPELEVDWRGPETKYTGTEATHFFRVRNPGTATAENVTVTVTLPDGAELVSASEGQSYNAGRRELSWRVGSLGPGDDYYMELKCIVNASGINRMNISAATSDGELVDTSVAETNVIALADLKLNVSDPKGPIAVGDEAVYEIRVQNRGASAAQGVNVVALFSEGVEPDTVEGAMYSVSDGRVSFRTIEELPAGKQIVLRIRAHAQQPGNHVFRAEVLCRELDIKLAAEETTRFYADQVFVEGEGAKQTEQPTQPAEASAVEVSDRYQTGPK